MDISRRGAEPAEEEHKNLCKCGDRGGGAAGHPGSPGYFIANTHKHCNTHYLTIVSYRCIIFAHEAPKMVGLAGGSRLRRWAARGHGENVTRLAEEVSFGERRAQANRSPRGRDGSGPKSVLTGSRLQRRETKNQSGASTRTRTARQFKNTRGLYSGAFRVLRGERLSRGKDRRAACCRDPGHPAAPGGNPPGPPDN